MTGSYFYGAYGLLLGMTFPCPALPPATAETAPDVIVEEGAVFRRLPAPAAEGIGWQAAPGRYLLRAGARCGRFLVEEGRRVTVQRASAAEGARLCHHLVHDVMAAVLRQRDLLTLHASTAVTPVGAVVIAGASGAGKSSALAALVDRGRPMLSDDLAAIRMGGDGRAEVLPGVAQIHLSEEAAAAVGWDISGLPRYPWRRGKAAVPAHAAIAREAVPLHALYWLQVGQAAGVRVRKLSGVEKFSSLQGCIYGPMLPDEHPAVFPLLSAILKQAAVWHVERPGKGWSLNETADAILDG